MVKKLFIGMVFLLIIALYIGNKMWNKPHLNIENTSAEIHVSADDILKSFKDDEVVASTKFINKVVAVHGKISSVKTDLNQITIQLETSDLMSNVICNLDSANIHKNSIYKEGELIVIKGICSGYLTDVILDRCVISK